VICRDAEALLSAYVDRELDIATSLEMEAHLAECRSCASALERAEALREAIQSAELAYAPPADLAPRLRAAIRHQARPRAALAQQVWRWAAIPTAAAAAAVFTWMVAVNPTGPGSRQPVLDELIAGHVRSLMVDHLVDVASTDQHTVRPWFNGKIDFAPPVADYASSGFPLIGGRVDYLAGRPVAALVYRHQQHVINVFLWPSGDASESAPRELSAQGYHLLRWSEGGLAYWAVSDLNARELTVLAELIRGSHS
jgi:anti-sigma factor RsiW